MQLTRYRKRWMPLTSRLDALEKQIEEQYLQGIETGYGFDPAEVPGHPDRNEETHTDEKE